MSHSLDDTARRQAREVEAWNPGEFADLLGSVVDETGENLEILSRDLLTMEKGGASSDIVNRCFRAAHNLKGLSHVIVINKLTMIAREMENLLEELRKGKREPNAPLIDVLLKSVDTIREGILPHMQARTPVATDITPILELLVQERNRRQDEGAPARPPADPPRVEAPPPAPNTTPPPPATAPPVSPAPVNAESPSLPGPTAPAPRAPVGAPPAPPPPPQTRASAAPAAGAADPVPHDGSRAAPLPLAAPAADGSRSATAPAQETLVAHRPEDRILRVGLNKLDALMNQVGELVIGKTRFSSSMRNLHTLRGELLRVKDELEATGRTRGEEQRISALSSEIDSLIWKHSLAASDRPDWTRVRQEVADMVERFRPNLAHTDLRDRVSDLRDDLDRVSRAFEELIRELEESLDHMGFISEQLQNEVMKVRMVPISQLFSKFPRMVRDQCRKLGKEVEVAMSGSETELDKLLVDMISEPLMHIVRNSLDHGIESPEERKRAGKPAIGTILLSADHKGGDVHIEVRDDGRGIDPVRVRKVAIDRGILRPEEAAALTDAQAIDLIFKPGFSTASSITDLSGRGVGMDVVRDAIATLKGSIFVETGVGTGTCVRVRLPLTLAIINAILVMKNNEVFAVPLTSVREMITIEPRDIRTVGNRQMINCRGETLFLRWLDDILGIEGTAWEERLSVPLVVIGDERRRLGIAVDRLLGRQEIVIKSLGALLRSVRCTLGSTILGDGRAVLILDPYDILEYVESSSSGRKRQELSPADPDPVGPEEEAEAPAKVSVLLVEDSKSIRAKMKEYLLDAGYQVVEAEDGQQGLEIAQHQTFDLVSSDINMPHMDGYELVKSLRKLPQYRHTPILLVSTKAEKMDRIRGFDAGADDYLVKPFNRETFLNLIRNNLRL